MNAVELCQVSKRFGNHSALNTVDLVVHPGEFVCVLGPSGCGKTTLLRLIAGLEKVDAGTLSLAGGMVSTPQEHVPPEKRNVGVVFQSYALWPHMNVTENIGYPLRVKKYSPHRRQEEVQAALESVRLTAYTERKPHELSGGQQQRVALARCLTQKAEIVLMDEPLANLDMHLRETMLREFKRFHKMTGATILYITHDQAEAMSVADRLVLLFDGRIVQTGTPAEVYEHPANTTVAGFIGVSAVFPVDLTKAGAMQIQGTEICLEHPAGDQLHADEQAYACIRPEDVVLGQGTCSGKVKNCTYLGGRFLVEVVLVGADEPLKGYSSQPLLLEEDISFTVKQYHLILESD